MAYFKKKFKGQNQCVPIRAALHWNKLHQEAESFPNNSIGMVSHTPPYPAGPEKKKHYFSAKNKKIWVNIRFVARETFDATQCVCATIDVSSLFILRWLAFMLTSTGGGISRSRRSNKHSGQIRDAQTAVKISAFETQTQRLSVRAFPAKATLLIIDIDWSKVTGLS